MVIESERSAKQQQTLSPSIRTYADTECQMYLTRLLMHRRRSVEQRIYLAATKRRAGAQLLLTQRYERVYC